jgi:hypothetical protein
MATTPWPDPSQPATNVFLQNDSDSITAARAELEDAINKLNLILTTVDQGATVWTDQNLMSPATVVTGTVSLGTVSAGGQSGTVTWVHGIPGSVRFGFAIKSGLGLEEAMFCVAIDSSGYVQTQIGSQIVMPVSPTLTYPVTPASGVISFKWKNESGSSVGLTARAWVSAL